jgi:hypothetical protein
MFIVFIVGCGGGSGSSGDNHPPIGGPVDLVKNPLPSQELFVNEINLSRYPIFFVKKNVNILL